MHFGTERIGRLILGIEIRLDIHHGGPRLTDSGSTYKRHARRATGSDTDRVPLDEWPELGSQRLLGHQVNGAAEQGFEIELETDISA